jgi:hypothetical protein
MAHAAWSPTLLSNQVTEPLPDKFSLKLKSRDHEADSISM